MRSSMICAVNRAGLGDKMQMNVVGGACGTYGEGWGVYGVLVGKTVRKMSVGRAGITGGADKSLARNTFRYPRTKSIVSLERGSVHVSNCKSVLVTEAERKHVRWRARFQQHRDVSCHQVSFFLQGKAPKEIHAILTETLGEYAPLYATV